ncbi:MULTISPECIES: DUF6415 family natural product biosynthesis protein [unclassified Streptomyces]|uniref:DUF6415 family natural product biosynthesis protein n=1 Tax=unclassified Streptomyces TaxID=2593676 RepID=UPI00017F2045|nr:MULTISPECIES: DUF6415 family natural product biosynthesis protein [unclassified Streptomyces]EDY43074.2 conserved hypothetical protein [Streptomyces sp. SPB074]MBP3078398.1 hypothetical protein [Streptomyces sp. 604F]QHV86508.1 hypothetical protein C3K23_17805 [Streptomyces sp. 604F]
MSLTALVPENDVVPPPANEPGVPKWTPPLDAGSLKLVLERITAWKPLDVEAIFDDLDMTIGNQPPPVAATGALIERLRDHLKRLSDIAVADKQFAPTVEMARLVELGRPMRDERTPADHQKAVGFARRLAFVTSDLVDELIEARYIKGQIEC